MSRELRAEEIKMLRNQGLSYDFIGWLLRISAQRVYQILNPKLKPKYKKQQRPRTATLRTREVAQLLNIHINTVRKWSNEGIIKSYRLSPQQQRRFLKKDVMKLKKAMLTETEVAKLLSVHINTVIRWRKEGLIKARGLNTGGPPRFLEKDVERPSHKRIRLAWSVVNRRNETLF